jgi:hypothetical protein
MERHLAYTQRDYSATPPKVLWGSEGPRPRWLVCPGLGQEAMSALRSDRTSFVIAHRLSRIRDADLIL